MSEGRYVVLGLPESYYHNRGKGSSPRLWKVRIVIYSENCIKRPPEKGGLCLKMVFISRSILHIIRKVCSEKGGLKIQVIVLDSGHIIQVSLYF